MHKRLLTILATITLSTALLVGCGNKQEEIPQATIEESAPEQTEEEITPPTEIAEQTPEATTEPVEEATTEPETTEPMETVEPEPTEEPTPEPQATYTYTDMSATMYAQQTVNVRDLPDTNGNKIGSLSTNDEITISAKCNETGWYRFEYNGSVAYVSNKYVGENKFEVQQQVSADNGGGQASSNTTMECPYPMLQVIDEGGDKVYYYYTPSTQNRNIYDECASIIASRHGWYIDVVNGGTAGSGGAGEAEKTNYTYNGEVVYRARPCTYLIGPNGGGPKDALEVVICP